MPESLTGAEKQRLRVATLLFLAQALHNTANQRGENGYKEKENLAKEIVKTVKQYAEGILAQNDLMGWEEEHPDSPEPEEAAAFALAATDKGKIIRRLRMENGFTQAALAEKIGATESFICQLETGKRHPKYETLCRIASALGVPINQFYEDGEPENERPQEGAQDYPRGRSRFIRVHRIIRGKNGEADTSAEAWINPDHIISIEPGGQHPGTRIILQGDYIRVTEDAAELLAQIRE